MLLIGEIQNIFLPLLLRQTVQKLKRQFRIHPDMLRRTLHLFHDRYSRQREILLHDPLQSLLDTVSNFHDLFTQLILRIRHDFRPAAGKPLKLHIRHQRLVFFYRPALQQRIRQHFIRTQRLFIGKGTARTPCYGQRLLDLFFQIPGRRLKLSQQGLLSDKIPEGSVLRQFVHGGAFLQPSNRLGTGDRIFIQLQDHLPDAGPPVSASVALCKTDEFRPAFSVGLLQKFLHRILFQQTHLSFIRDPEARIQVYGMKIIPDHIEAEAVNRGDLRPGHQRLLSLKPLVPRVFLKSGKKRLPDPLLHLPCRRSRKGGNQQPVHIHRMSLISNQRQDPLHQHRCLAGTCGCRHQKIFPSGIDHLFLIFRPCHTHISSSCFACCCRCSHISIRSIGRSLRFSHPSTFRSNPQTL